jgi:hypothetical protein
MNFLKCHTLLRLQYQNAVTRKGIVSLFQSALSTTSSTDMFNHEFSKLGLNDGILQALADQSMYDLLSLSILVKFTFS